MVSIPILFPNVTEVRELVDEKKRLYIGAYGFEIRSTGWTSVQLKQGAVLKNALVIKYLNPKGENLIKELKSNLGSMGVSNPKDLLFDHLNPYGFEIKLQEVLDVLLQGIEEIVLDISALTKLLILVFLCVLNKYSIDVRIVYSEARDYPPSKDQYEEYKDQISALSRFLPSSGFATIVRMKCLSSIRMQGQPVTIIAFTSFNEQLLRHMLATISPHRLRQINGRPPKKEFRWREHAMQEIHERFVRGYPLDNNPLDSDNHLTRVASTLDYMQTINILNVIYKELGTYEKIICAATGSKMQTVGLALFKLLHHDIHIEYPTPDSYYIMRGDKEIEKVHEIFIPSYSNFISMIQKSASAKLFKQVDEYFDND